MAKGGSELAGKVLEGQEVAGEYRRAVADAASRREARVLGIQTKLHHWATDDPDRRFDDLFNLVHDPAFLLVGMAPGQGQQGRAHRGRGRADCPATSAVCGAGGFLADLRAELKARTFRPLPVRERLIPKPGGSKRRLGIPTVTDRVVQAALKLVLEPIFEADFQPCSLWVPPQAARPGRHRRDPPPHQPTGWL